MGLAELGWRRWLRQFLDLEEQYGSPGKLLSNLDRDHEAAGRDLASRFDRTYPQTLLGMLDAEGADAREAARHRLSKELHDTWRPGQPYSKWVAKAARQVGI